ncbi:sugar ABC transporter substrate-binding protein [Nocardia suismassiliense]|uniref:sugar ABC transporter substrate-binding protein n=1 Tax=Nocardia suismassiliense TaxID=2077092 RepID=UPI000D1EF6BD|nr:sugar ABC transporter substrate-binding protein [Nocardia suismassiliense]
MRRIQLLTAAAAALVLAAGCSSGDSTRDAKSGGDNPTIALLLPESKTTRYEAFDRPLFEAKVKQLCEKCKVLYFNADQDAAKQQGQFESALTQGADVIVFDAVNADAVAPQVNTANQKNIPVIAYDRLISGISYDYYVSFDNVKVGKVQGEALLAELTKRGTLDKGQLVVINGSPTDPSAGDYKKGAHEALDGKVKIGREFDTPDWSPDKAQQQMEQAITALGKDAIVGVYSANDGMAGGAIAALKRAGYATLPPLTGQDAELAGVQRILTGEQTMTIYLDYRAQAEKAAELAVALAYGEKPVAPAKTNNGVTDIPSYLLEAIAVGKDNIKDTIVKDGLYTVADICTPDVAAACQAAGIK